MCICFHMECILFFFYSPSPCPNAGSMGRINAAFVRALSLSAENSYGDRVDNGKGISARFSDRSSTASMHDFSLC